MNKLALLAIALSTVSCSSDEDPSGPAGSGGASGSGGTTASGGTGGTTSTGGTGGTTASGGTGGTTASGGTGGTGASSGSAGTAGVGGSAGTGGSVPEAGPDAPGDVQVEVGPVSSCDELSTVACFANQECESDRRCENMGTEIDQVPCCVLGTRGTGQPGDTCTNETDCESGVCISKSGPSLCSKPCTTDDDCPDGMKDCKYIAFSGSEDDWCFPTN